MCVSDRPEPSAHSLPTTRGRTDPVHSNAVTVDASPETTVHDIAGRLRTFEKVGLGFLLYATFASLIFPLPNRARMAVLALNVASAGVLLLASRLDGEKRSPLADAVRDWFPAILILLAYRESGLFVIPDPSHRLDYLFETWDVAILSNPSVRSTLSSLPPWLPRYLEFCYLLCYPIVPLGLASLYLAREANPPAGALRDRMFDRYWTTVLLALLSCYVLFPLFPSTTPRSFFHDLAAPFARPLFRNVNLWVLGQYGIDSSVFPSGHVAGVTATALAVRAYMPRLGVLFLLVAVSIAVATILGRYHYTADAVAGGLIGVAAYLISNRIHRP